MLIVFQEHCININLKALREPVLSLYLDVNPKAINNININHKIGCKINAPAVIKSNSNASSNIIIIFFV